MPRPQLGPASSRALLAIVLQHLRPEGDCETDGEVSQLGANFAFYGRVSTEDQQDPTSSKQWQMARAESILPAGAKIVREYFDIGQSRSLPWKRRPEAAALLKDLRDSSRGFGAVVIGEPARAFYGAQFQNTFPLFTHHGVQLWVPDVGGYVDPESDGAEMMMAIYGTMSTQERRRVQVRVKSAMKEQARVEGRFLGGRPPFGYTLADAGQHPNPGKAADGKRRHKLELDPTAAPVVIRIFDEYLSGKGFYAIAEGLTKDGIPSPSAHDPLRNRHRQSSRGAWSKSAVRTILQNPRYTGHQVWSRQRRDEVLIDVEDVALGNASKMRWNSPDKWIWSEVQVHDAIVDEAVFDRVQALFSAGTRQPAEKTRRARQPYILRGILFCGRCGRRMQGSHNNRTLNYRCRYPNEYASSSLVDHPRNVYVRQDAIEPRLDEWIGQVFDPENVEQTCATLTAACQPDRDAEGSARSAAQKAIKDCDQRLNQYRRLLDEGTDPKTVASWIAEVQMDRDAAEQALAKLKPRQTLTEADVRHMIEQVEDGVKMLSEAEPEAKNALYAALGIRLTYDPERKRVTVEAQPNSWGLDRVGGGT